MKPSITNQWPLWDFPSLDPAKEKTCEHENMRAASGRAAHGSVMETQEIRAVNDGTIRG